MSEANTTKACPKCNGQMERGGLRGDSSLIWGRVREESIFGAKAVQMIAPYFTVDAYRCGQCGFVELYAINQQGK